MDKIRMLFVLIFILLITVIPGGCSQSEQEISSQPQVIDTEDPPEETTDDPKEIDLTDKIKSPLTGLYIESDQLNDRVIAVMIDNLKPARPQAGISQCDIVYEMQVEGNITRYMGIW
ncbi:MAG: DUF3048 domain-containing protein, partial [Clostridia bacterium]|nr:DUF3048 domain-containing protein [Clostridia bacterium]